MQWKSYNENGRKIKLTYRVKLRRCEQIGYVYLYLFIDIVHIIYSIDVYLYVEVCLFFFVWLRLWKIKLM